MQGAEVIIPAGGLPMLLFARESPFIIDGAPVLNGIAVVAKAAEMALALKAITKVVVSRRSTYAKALAGGDQRVPGPLDRQAGRPSSRRAAIVSSAER